MNADNKSKTKINRGQYNTTKNTWLYPHVLDFINSWNKKQIVIDPFAGKGDLLNVCKLLGFSNAIGLDIDKRLNNKYASIYNDSLENIPYSNVNIITNPPYLAKNSAKRKDSVSYKYFKNNDYSDLYLLGLEKCLNVCDKMIAIVPETYILTKYFSQYCVSISIVEDNLFVDTDCPVSVVCFDKMKLQNDILIYKNDKFINSYNKLPQLEPFNNIDIVFNCKNGNIGLRGIDGQSSNDKIKFCLPSELDYDLDKIKVSSRAITVIDVDLKNADINQTINNANTILNNYRKDTGDVLLASFKGNNKANERRRRIDFKTARAILEQAVTIRAENK